MLKKVAILPGFSEGHWHASKLLHDLKEQGFEPTSTDKASILITHSAGIYLSQAKKKYDLLVICGLPALSRTKTLFTLNRKIYRDYKRYKHAQGLKHWLHKTSFNTYYFIRHPVTWFRMLANLDLNNSNKLNAKQVVVIINRDDVFNTPEQLQKIAKKNSWKFYIVDGQHDDLWDNQSKYTAIIKECL